MALIDRATHVLQWLLQRVAQMRVEANPLKAAVVQIAVCNSHCMKEESVVIADQHAAVNIFAALYTPPVKFGECSRPVGFSG